MKAIKKRKSQVEKFYYYKGQMIWVNSVYLSPSERRKWVSLHYCPIEGNDLYFKSVGRAKAYVDSCHMKTPVKSEIPF